MTLNPAIGSLSASAKKSFNCGGFTRNGKYTASIRRA